MEQVREPVVLDPMMAVPLRPLSVQNGVTASVLPINLEDLSVDLDLIIMLNQKQTIQMIPKEWLTMSSMIMKCLTEIWIRDKMKMK